MGCFPIMHPREEEEEGEKSTSTGKRSKLLWWKFSLVFSRGSKTSSESTTTNGSRAEVVERGADPKLQDLRIFTLSELKSATKNFSESEKLGEGGFGTVYRGHVKSKKTDDRTDVAVKKLNVKGQQGHREWLSEITYLRMVDHPNLVKLLGYCLEDDDRGPQCLLVYELMPNKSLDDHIFRTQGPVLPWDRRLLIALATAKGLAYLHEGVKPSIIYRDLKAANILLDNQFNPKLSDFGLARDGPTMGATHVTTAVVGTAGYAAPEYVQTGHLTVKSDVWSFGMVLLELITGRRALDLNRPRSERSLSDWVKPYWNDPRKIRKIMDPRLEKQYPIDEARAILSLAQKCTAKYPKLRPKMSEVVRQLESIMQPEERSNTGGDAVGSSVAVVSTWDSSDTSGSLTPREFSGNVQEIHTSQSLDDASACQESTCSGQEAEVVQVMVTTEDRDRGEPAEAQDPSVSTEATDTHVSSETKPSVEGGDRGESTEAQDSCLPAEAADTGGDPSSPETKPSSDKDEVIHVLVISEDGKEEEERAAEGRDSSLISGHSEHGSSHREHPHNATVNTGQHQEEKAASDRAEILSDTLN